VHSCNQMLCLRACIRPVNVASGTGIVYSGGGQTRAVTLNDQLDGMRESSSNSSDNTTTMATRGKSGADFIFDVDFLTANPQVSLAYHVPTMS
jgi:hypothetical protein